MKKILSKLLTVALLGTIALSFTNCNEQVPAGHKGKILGKNGWQPEVYPPSKVWVDTLSPTPEKLFVIQTTTQKYNQPIKVLLKDKLTLRAEIVFRGRVTGNDKVLNGLFNDMPMNDSVVTTSEVYDTYAKQIVMNTAREVISKYNIDEVNTNYARITTELYNAIKPKLKGLPIDISDVTLGNIQYPSVVTDAINAAKERQMAIQKEKAQVQIELTKARGAEEVAKANYKVRMLEAKQIRDYNKMINSGITKDLIRLKEIEVEMQIAKNLDGNANVVYMPLPMMNGSGNIRVIK